MNYTVNMGDVARLYLKALNADYDDQSRTFYDILDKLHGLNQLVKEGAMDEEQLETVLKRLYAKWDEIEVELDD